MRSIRHIVICSIISLIVVAGCKKQKDPSVTMLNGSFITANKVISPGTDLPFKWRAEKGSSSLYSFTISVNGENWIGHPITSIPEDIYTDSAFLDGPVIPGHYAFSFVVTDTDGKSGEKTIMITVE